MKILAICQHYYPEQFRITDICETLANQRNDVTILAGLPNYPTGIVPKEYKFFRKRKEIINNVKVIRCFEIGRRKGKIWRILNYLSYMISASFKAIFLKRDFDAIYVYQLSPITMAIPAIIYKKTHKNKKINLYCLDLWPDSLLVENFSKDGKVYKITKKLSKWVYNKFDSISVSSEEFKNYFREELNIDKDIVYMPQYAEDLFSNIEQKSINKSDSINLVFAGNIGKAQSVETIISAASKLENQKIKIHIVGDGTSLEECKELAKKLGVDNITFYGRKPIEEMNYYYNMADAMLITLSNNEVINKTIPGKLQSYMAARKPVIGAISGAANNIIKESECGYCVDSEDYIGLADIMDKFALDSAEGKIKMANNSYNYYKENFAKEKFINKLLNILQGGINNV